MAKSTGSTSSCASKLSDASASSSVTTTTTSAKSNDRKRGDRLHMKWASSMDRRKRLAANARERKRMHLLNEAYDLLRARLADAENKSKYDVLVQAKEYIQALSSICEKFDEQNPPKISIKSPQSTRQPDNNHSQRHSQQAPTQQASIGSALMSPSMSIVISPSPPMSNESDHSQSTNEACCRIGGSPSTSALLSNNIASDFARFYPIVSHQEPANIAQATTALFSPPPQAQDYSIHSKANATTSHLSQPHSQLARIKLERHQVYRFPTSAT